MVDLKGAILRLNAIAALAEGDFMMDKKKKATDIFIDREDVLALKGAVEILEGVQMLRKMVGTEVKKREA